MNPTEVKFLDYLDVWLKQDVCGNVVNGTFISYSCAVKQLKAIMENKEVDKITVQEYQEALNQLAKMGYSRSTIAKVRTVIYLALDSLENTSFENRRIKLKLPQNATTRKVYPLEDKEQQLIEQACLTDPYGDVFLFLLYTGLRRSELRRLQWNHIDWNNACMWIEKSKTQHGIRIVPLLPICLWILQRQPRYSEYVFTLRLRGKLGQPITEYSLRRTYERLRKNTNIQSLTNHVCRHSFATRLLEEGAEVKSIAELMGHSDVSFTLNQYVYPSKDYLKNQMSVLNHRLQR